jgi:hypothetical protein
MRRSCVAILAKDGEDIFLADGTYPSKYLLGFVLRA